MQIRPTLVLRTFSNQRSIVTAKVVYLFSVAWLLLRQAPPRSPPRKREGRPLRLQKTLQTIGSLSRKGAERLGGGGLGWGAFQKFGGIIRWPSRLEVGRFGPAANGRPVPTSLSA